MTEFIRKLTFQSKDLGADATLVLTFNDDKIPGIYNTIFPTAFKVSEFGKKEIYTLEVVYKAQLGFTRAQISSTDVVQPAATSIPINVGQETSLTKKGKLYSFSEPTSLKPPNKQIIARNDTDGKENIGVGFFDDPEEPPSTLLVFEGVGAGSLAQVQFKPVLRGYVIVGYQENAIMRGQIATPVLFNQDLTQLAESTKWILTFNPGNNKYSIDAK